MDAGAGAGAGARTPRQRKLIKQDMAVQPSQPVWSVDVEKYMAARQTTGPSAEADTLKAAMQEQNALARAQLKATLEANARQDRLLQLLERQAAHSEVRTGCVGYLGKADKSSIFC